MIVLLSIGFCVSNFEKVGMMNYLNEDKPIAFGRAISVDIYEGAIYDVAVLPEYQGKGIGRMIITILLILPNCNEILFTAPGKELFYEKSNFRS